MDDKEKTDAPSIDNASEYNEDEVVNTSGHVQELDRTFGFWSICSVSILADNAWANGSSALVVALYNGGGPGVMYGLIASFFFYSFIGASLAELASAIPSSANVYHWASVTAGPRYGRVFSWYAGWWNCLAWIVGAAGPCFATANAIIAMYALYHPDYVPQRWQVFVTYIGVCALTTSTVLFGQRVLARLSKIIAILCLTMGLITILMCAIYPSQTGYGYASNSFVWTDFENLTGWSSDGFVFLAGMLNGAYALGTPDVCCHMAEEVPKPRVNVPRSIAAQLSFGFITAFATYTALLYGVTSIDDVFNSRITSLPLAEIFYQCTRSNGATFGLLFIFVFDQFLCISGAWIAAGRILWTLGRDNATPFPNWVAEVSPTWRNPFNAQLAAFVVATALGAIYVASATAFSTFIGAFAILTTLSFVTPFLPYIFTARKYVKPGPFYIPGVWGYVVFGIASAYIIVFNVIFMFPYVLPVTYSNMNWECVMCGGLTILMTLGYLYKRQNGYIGPQVAQNAHDDIMKGTIGLDKEIQRRRAATHGH